MKLEDNIAKLEELSQQLDDNIGLEKSIEIFSQSIAIAEEAMKQLNDCKGKLYVLQNKLSKLTENDD